MKKPPRGGVSSSMWHQWQWWFLCFAMFCAGYVFIMALIFDAQKTRLASTYYLYTHKYKNIISTTIDDEYLHDELTVVTAYIDIGSFQKGHNDQFYPSLYKKWMGSFINLTNPVIAFMEPEYAAYFKQLRSHLPSNLTVVHTVTKQELWSFSLKPRIQEIFDTQNTVVSYPNTVIPEYSCAMHAKYEFMLTAVKENPFKTKYFSWLDIGLFRDLTEMPHGQPFNLAPYKLWLPENFEEKKVAYSQINSLSKTLTVQDVFMTEYVWLCGCFFVGRASVIAKWSVRYMEAVEWLLREGYMSTDQQVITAMYATDSKVHPTVKIQEYKQGSTTHYNSWFYLGYLCRDAGSKKSQ